MKNKLPLIARVLLGLLFLMAGIVGLFNLVPPPAEMPVAMETFNKGLAASGYFMTLLKLTEVICALMLLSGFFVPLALVILAPIVINIFLVHAFLDPSGLPVAIVAGFLMIYLSFFSAPYSPPIKQLFRS